MSKKPSLIYVIAGPTASGKSARALELARAMNGVIIHADSRQIYDGLPILAAQPTTEEKSEIPHELYGVIHPNDNCSAGIWRDMAHAVIRKTLDADKAPIVVGGTGLYLRALIDGLSRIPNIPDEIREAAIKKQEELGNPAFHAELAKRDPVMAARFHPSHTARLVRAWEVLEATGKSLAEWQNAPPDAPPKEWKFQIEKIMPPRDALNNNCDARFLKMMEIGALEEVKNFQAKIESGAVREDAPLTKSLGFQPLVDFLKNRISRDEAITQAQTETRQYAKRQMTWFRHQL